MRRNLEKNPNIQNELLYLEAHKGEHSQYQLKKLAPMIGHQPDSLQWISENHFDKQSKTNKYLDLCKLETNEKTTAKSIIQQLLKTNSLAFSLKAASSVDSLLSSLNNDQKILAQYNGSEDLGIGFPILQIKDNQLKKNILAPLFIWNINLQPENDSERNWQLIHPEEHQIRLHSSLIRLLQQQYKIDLPKLCEPIVDKKQINAIVLSKICYELSGALGQKEDIFLENIEPLSGVSNQTIHCAAVLGSFPAKLHFSKKNKKDIHSETAHSHNFGLSVLDPWQLNAAQGFWQQSSTQLRAGHGTGKSHLLHHLLSNALSCGKTSLVVADSTRRIEKIRNEFSAHGLDHLLLDIRNPDHELNNIIQAINYKSSTPKEQFDQKRFDYLINRCKRLKDRLDTVFSMLDQNIFDKKNWSEIVGAFLHFNRIEKRELLDNQLQAKDFTFHPTEHQSLQEAILTSEPLFEKINTLKHPLTKLHPNIFLEKNKEEAKQLVQQQLEHFYQKFTQLHHRYILKQQDYSRDLKNKIEDFYAEALSHIEQLKDQIEDNRLIYGNEFEDSGLIQTGRLKVYGVFSGKHKNILQARNQINEDFKKLSQLIKQNIDETFAVLDSIDAKPISKVHNHLNELEDQLYQWYDQSTEQIQEELQRLNTKSVQANLDYKEQISELEYSLDIELEALNNSEIFKENLENKMLTIPMRQLFIQDILSQLNFTKNQLAQFDIFYDWQRHWLLLPEIHRKLLSAIIKVNPNNWAAAFQSWYFFQLLNSGFHFKMPKNDTLLKEYESACHALKELLPTQIRQLWKQTSSNKKLLKKLNNIGFNKLFSEYLPLIKKQFPVIVITEPVAARLLAEQELDFDLAFIFNTESKSTLSQVSGLNVDHSLFFDTTPNLEKNNNSVFHLNTIFKKTSKTIFDFFNVVIFNRQKRLIYFQESATNCSSVISLTGKCKDDINLQEAEQIINDLCEKAEIKSKQPKTVVICSTVAQRDFIQQKISSIIKSNNSQAQMLQQLKQQGLGIFHIEDPFENNYEQLIFSTVIHSLNHSTNDWLNNINSKNGLYYLQSLISRNFTSIRIYHSLSKDDIEKHLSNHLNKGSSLLASWINYHFLLKDRKQVAQKELLPEHLIYSPEKSTLVTEIANELVPFIGKQRIQNNNQHLGTGPFFTVLPQKPEGKSTLIMINGNLETKGNRSHLWSIYFNRLLNNAGINTYTVWSAKWFESPGLEARKMASAILKTDRQ